jgi:hypothetical protein
MRFSIATLLIAPVIGAAGCSDASAYRTDRPDPEPLHEAVHALSSVMVYDIFSPPQASRAYAYASVAAYEAIRPGYASHQTLAGQLNGLTEIPAPPADSEYYPLLAGVHAFLTVSRALTFSQARIDSARVTIEKEIRGRGLPDDVAARSIAYGERVAAHILAWSKQDHYLETRGMPKYTVEPAPGRWVPTPPAYMDAIEPNWDRLRAFTMDSSSQFKPLPPLPFDSARTSPFMREALETYTTVNTLTPEQRHIAAFWDCNPYVMHVQGHAMFATKKITPGGHWMSIVGIVSRQSHADLIQSASAYARTAVALADAFISNWDEKFRSDLVRPETVINRYVDENWTPLLQTPPFPEYTSGHSVISTAAATVLTDEFGANVAFHDDTEESFGIPPRDFPSFEAAAAEARISRLYGGIHFRRAIEEGGEQGRRVGENVLLRMRTRADGAPSVAAAGARSSGAPAAAPAAAH